MKHIRKKEGMNMFAQAHKFVGENVIEEVKVLSGYSIERNRFLWGNVKPDFVPELLIKKHYIEEMFPVIVKQIWRLSNCSKDWLFNPIKKQRFDEELGVISHFLSDFFCVPHNQRWEFKHSMKPHIQYEKTLNQKMEIYQPKNQIPELTPTKNSINNSSLRMSKADIERYLEEWLFEYKLKQDYMRDYQYSIDICTRIILFIISSILSRSEQNNWFDKKLTPSEAFESKRKLKNSSKNLKLIHAQK